MSYKTLSFLSRFVVMSEEDAGEILGTEHIVEVQS